MNSVERRVIVDDVTATLGSDWVPLRYLSIYRLLVAVLFVGLDLFGRGPRLIGSYEPVMFERTAAVYLALCIVYLLAVRRMWPAFHAQVALQTITDIAVFVVLMHASGGVNSGFGILMIVSIAGASILTYGRNAVAFSALATLAVLAEQIAADLDEYVPIGDYTHCGLLGLTYFTTAVLSHFSARRVRLSESLAARRAVDLAGLAQLNEHII
ncbi:MAG: hypothetical protein HOI95_06490, partial [Chromatiales bacterium]|nr:hypothetical protein [Chromatiales bacterium]